MLFVVLSILIALGLRLVAINQSLWLDEAISASVATQYSLKEIFVNFLPGDFNPPLYYLILYFWLKIFPQSEFFIRLPSVIFGLAACFYVYLLAKAIFKDKKLALFSLALLAASPLHIYYSQEARAYSLTAFLVTASMYYFIRLFKEKNKSSLLITHYSLLTALMLYSHYLAWFALFAQLFYLILWQKDKIKILITHYSLLITLYIPWLPIFFKQLKAGLRVSSGAPVWRKVIGSLGFKTVSLLPVKFIIGRTYFNNKSLYFAAAGLLVLFFSFLLFKSLKRASRFISLLWLWLLLPPVLGIIISFKIPIFSYFRFLFCLPAFYLLASRGVFNINKKGKFLVLLLVINIFFSLRYLIDDNFHREDWKNAIKNLHQQNNSQAPVLILENISAPFDYYDKNKSQKIFISQKERIIKEKTVWLFPYALPIFDPQEQTRDFLDKAGFSLVFERHFRGITLEKWQK